MALWISISSIDKVSNGWIRNLGFKSGPHKLKLSSKKEKEKKGRVDLRFFRVFKVNPP